MNLTNLDYDDLSFIVNVYVDTTEIPDVWRDDIDYLWNQLNKPGAVEFFSEGYRFGSMMTTNSKLQIRQNHDSLEVIFDLNLPTATPAQLKEEKKINIEFTKRVDDYLSKKYKYNC